MRQHCWNTENLICSHWHENLIWNIDMDIFMKWICDKIKAVDWGHSGSSGNTDGWHHLVMLNRAVNCGIFFFLQGSVYQKTNAMSEIRKTNKDNFWAQAEVRSLNNIILTSYLCDTARNASNIWRVCHLKLMTHTVFSVELLLCAM